MSGNWGKCETCSYYEKSTKFCRYNPPVPVVKQSIQNDSGKLISVVKSAYPMIEMPSKDWCSKYE